MQASLGATAWFPLSVGRGDIWFEDDTNRQNVAYQWKLKVEIPQEGLGRAAGRNRYLTEPVDVWQWEDRMASEVCGVKYSGCVLRSSRVLFGGLLQEDIFLHFFFFFFFFPFGRREWNYRENWMFPYTNSHVWTHRMLHTCLLVVSQIRGMKEYTTRALVCCFLVSFYY